MLDLNVPVRSVAGIDLAADHEDPFSYYVLPPPPRVFVRDGEPQVELLRFIKDGQATGGNLRLTACLEHPAAKLEEVRQALVDECKDDRVALHPVPVVDATAELDFIGRETTETGSLGPLVRRDYGRTAAMLDPPHQASFSVSLSAEGVQLMEAALRSGGAPIGVVYRVRIEGLWPAERVIARVDWGRVYDHLSMAQKEGCLFAVADLQSVTERLVEDRSIVIQTVCGVVPDGPASQDDLAPALAWVQRELVERFCEPVMPLNREPAHASLGTLGEIFGVGSSFAFKQLTQIERAVAEVDFQRSLVVSRTLVLESHLADLLAGVAPEGHIADAGLDHPFFRRMSLHVQTMQPLEDLFLKEVLLQFQYGSASDSIRLTPQEREGSVDTWADAAPDRTWSLRPDVTFDDNAPVDAGQQFHLPAFTGQSRELALDLRRLLGMVRCEVRAAPDPRVLMSQVRLVHWRGEEQRAERDFALTPQAPQSVAWFRDFQPGDRLEASSDRLLADGRIVTNPPSPVETEILRLPPAFPGVLTVQLLSDDDWTGLERVVVALQKAPELPTGSFTFDKPSQSVAVNLDMPDPLDRKFRYRATRTWSSGQVEEDDWAETDVAVVVVGRVAANVLVVDVTPVGAELPEAGIRLIEVELSYIDAENLVRQQHTAVIASRSDTFHWQAPIHDPRRRNYEYRITVYRTAGGPPEVGPWITSKDRLLIVPIVKAPG